MISLSSWLAAVEFMWDCIVESVDKLKNKQDCNQIANGNGCILAHCMGLGKTLSVSFTFLDAFLDILRALQALYCFFMVAFIGAVH